MTPMGLPGHRALVIGACGAIGSAVATAYADAGARVWAADRAGAHALARSLAGNGHGAGAVDVTDHGSVERLVATAFADETLDSVVYAAGANYTDEVVDTVWADYERVMAVNLRGAFHTAQVVTRRLLDTGCGGSVAFLASTAGKRGEAGASVYCATKFGLIGLVECLAAEAAASGIRANAVCPGNVDSPMLRALAQEVAEREGRRADQVLRRFADESPRGQLVRPDEVAGVCLWLASPLAAGVSGEAINVDAAALTG